MKQIKGNPFSIAFNFFIIKSRISWHFTLQPGNLSVPVIQKDGNNTFPDFYGKQNYLLHLKSPVVNQAISILLSIIYNQWFVWQRNELCSNHLSNILVINNAPSEVVFVFSVGEQMGSARQSKEFRGKNF